MRTPHLLALAASALVLTALGCPSEPKPSAEPPKTEAPAQPASQPASQPGQAAMPANHPTSTTPITLEQLFEMPKIDGPHVAEVGADKVTQDELGAKLRELQLQLSVAGVPPGTTREKILQAALDQLVERKLMKQLAEEMKVKPDPKRIAAFLKSIDDRIKADPKFGVFLASAGNTPEQRRRDGEHIARVEAVQLALRGRIQARTATTVEAYYEKRKADFMLRGGTEAWRIVIRAPSTMVQRDRDIAKVRALEIHKKVSEKPAEFENLARIHSEGGKGNEGGYIGFVPNGGMDPDLDKVLHAAKAGSILPLVEDARGFYIYKVGGKREGRQGTLEEVRDEIFNRLYRGIATREINKEISRLSSKRQVKVHIPELTSQ